MSIYKLINSFPTECQEKVSHFGPAESDNVKNKRFNMKSWVGCHFKIYEWWSNIVKCTIWSGAQSVFVAGAIIATQIQFV